MVRASIIAAICSVFLGGAAFAQGAGGENAGTEQMGGKSSASPDGTGVNPYSGKEVGEPLKPDDLGYGAPDPKIRTEQ